MSNVLSDERPQLVVALGRLGWSLRRVDDATGARRETASVYLKAAGIAVRGRGGRGATWFDAEVVEVRFPHAGPFAFMSVAT
jgi:hypothetical protein